MSLRPLLSLALVMSCTPTHPASPAAEAMRLFAERHLSGAIVVQDVRTGASIVSLDVGDGANGLPLSAVKLLLMTSYWEHEREAPSVSPDANAIIARGQDDPGRSLAIELRHTLGSQTMLDELARFGFPSCARRPDVCTSLSAATSDTDWANALSLGEIDFRTTPEGLSQFLVAVGNGGVRPDGVRVMGAQTAARLRTAMLETVRSGTAHGVAARLGNLAQMGGKTGTGPAGHEPYDGVFAGLIFDKAGRPRFSVVTYVRRGGYGGGAAAEISADIGRFLLTLGRS